MCLALRGPSRFTPRHYKNKGTKSLVWWHTPVHAPPTQENATGGLEDQGLPGLHGELEAVCSNPAGPCSEEKGEKGRTWLGPS